MIFSSHFGPKNHFFTAKSEDFKKYSDQTYVLTLGVSDLRATKNFIAVVYNHLEYSKYELYMLDLEHFGLFPAAPQAIFSEGLSLMLTDTYLYVCLV